MLPIPFTTKSANNFGRQINRSHWQSKGLLLLFSFDERSGRKIYDHASSLVGDLYNTSWQPPSPLESPEGLDFPYIAGNFRATFPELQLPEQSTVHFEFKWGFGVLEYGFLLGGPGPGTVGWPLFYGGYCRIWSNGSQINIPLTFDGRERFTLTIVRGPTRTFLYKNGVHIASEWNITAPIISCLGSQPSGGDVVNGTVFDFRVYDYAFSPEQVYNLHTNPKDIWLTPFKLVLPQSLNVPLPPEIIYPTSGTLTNDSTPVFSGTALSGATVQLYNDGDLIASGISDGSWSFTSTGVLVDGVYLVSGTATDQFGTSDFSSTTELTIDTVAPVGDIISPSEELSLPASTLNASGTAEANCFVQIYDNSNLVTSGVVDGAGNWNFTLSGLAEGAHLFEAVFTDSAGNSSIEQATFTVDTVPPLAPIIVTPTNGSYTNNPIISISGYGEFDTDVYFRANGGDTFAIAIVEIAPSGFLAVADEPLPDGIYSISGYANDGNWNSVASNVVTVTIDTVAPDEPSIIYPASGVVIHNSTPTVSGTAEGLSSVVLYSGVTAVGSGVTNSGGAWSITTSSLINGVYTITAVAIDAAGNESNPSEEVIFEVDAQVPVPPVILSPLNGSITNNALLSLSGYATLGTQVTFYANGDYLGQATADISPSGFAGNADILLPDGVYSISGYSSNMVGDSLPSNVVIVTIDTVSPSGLITYPSTGLFKPYDLVNIQGTSTEAELEITLLDNGSYLTTITGDVSGNWEYLATLSPGVHEITAVFTDSALNSGTHSTIFTLGDIYMSFEFEVNNRIISVWDGSTFREQTLSLTGTSGIAVIATASSFVISGTADWVALSGAVMLSGDQEISGIKTFLDSVNFSSPVAITSGIEPPLNTASGRVGELRWSDDSVYLCIAENSWKRITLADF